MMVVQWSLLVGKLHHVVETNRYRRYKQPKTIYIKNLGYYFIQKSLINNNQMFQMLFKVN